MTAGLDPETERARALVQYLVKALDDFTAIHDTNFAEVLLAARTFHRTTASWVAVHHKLKGDNRLGFFKDEVACLDGDLLRDHERLTKELDPRGN